MIRASGTRIGWADLPLELRQEVEQQLGGPVVEAVSQIGGFSPGTADRVRTVDGQKAFVKAVSSGLNEVSPRLHRREARVAALLPPEAPAPRLLGQYDDGDWIALIFEDVEGRHPTTPWRADELDRVLAVLRKMATGPAPVELPKAEDRLAGVLGGWLRIDADPPEQLDPWAAQRLPELCALADRGRAALAGDRLAHTDLRADNLLLGPGGTVTLVDWPDACRAAPWLDTVLLLVNVRLFGGLDAQARLVECATTFGADPADLVGVLVALAGYFLDGTRQPAPEGLPTLRAFQRVQGEAVLSWLKEQPEFSER
jgi:aminoglycoside phosphotransferase (APT) family kinase protein